MHHSKESLQLGLSAVHGLGSGLSLKLGLLAVLGLGLVQELGIDYHFFRRSPVAAVPRELQKPAFHFAVAIPRTR
jgi:hypothetical protein